MKNVLAILLAGGAGERLFPLTRDTAKPAVPFGGAYRIIDFTLSNCINSGLRRIFVLTQSFSPSTNPSTNTGVKIPESSVIGFNLDEDRARGHSVTDADRRGGGIFLGEIL